MVKIDTIEKRNNPKRKRRLRKKLHVAEFKSVDIVMKIYGLADNTDDDGIDDFLDYIEKLSPKYGWKGGYVMFTYEDHSIIHVPILHAPLIESGDSDEYVHELSNQTNYEIELISIKDSWYSDYL